MTREEILAIRATGLALVAQCDAALARVDEPKSKALVESGGLFEPWVCLHPSERLISTGVAGSPHRKKCTVCGNTLEPVEA